MNPYQLGREARIIGKTITENPYFLGSSGWKRWRQGWLDADKDKLQSDQTN